MPLKQEVADQLTGEWQTGLFEAPCTAPMSFCYGCCCMCCMAGQQRLEILEVTGEEYVCCGGMFPCGPLGQPQNKNCVWAEACCCIGAAVGGNRFMIQTRFDRQNTACDDCLLWVTCLLPWVICCCECAGVDVPEEIEHCVHWLTIIVNGCMLAQQQVELRYIKKHGYHGPPPGVVSMLPPQQQQMMSQARPGAFAAGVGAIVGGAAGAGAMYSHAQAQQQTAPQPQTMGYQHGVESQQAYVQTPMVQQGIPVKGGGVPDGAGFMGSMAPNGMTWMQYCQSQAVQIDPSSGFLTGAWGECLAWAKVFEVQNPGWANDPTYAKDGPCGQVIMALCDACPRHMRDAAERGAEQLEEACGQAAGSGRPLPIIGQRA